MTENNTDFSTMSNGGVNARYNSDRKTVNVEPMKVTGDIKDDPVKGLAKASPKFQPVKAEEEQSDEDKKKAVAKKTKKIEKE